MRIDGSGTGAWHRDRETQSFGSRAWRDHYGASSGARRAHADMMSRDRARHELADIEARLDAEAFEAFEYEAFQIVREHTDELAAGPIRWNHRAQDALIVRIQAPAGISESNAAALLSHGFRWSHRRGGMWWAPRTPEACRIAERICEPVTCVTE
jgi:hypothetical protein